MGTQQLIIVLSLFVTVLVISTLLLSWPKIQKKLKAKKKNKPTPSVTPKKEKEIIRPKVLSPFTTEKKEEKPALTYSDVKEVKTIDAPQIIKSEKPSFKNNFDFDFPSGPPMPANGQFGGFKDMGPKPQAKNNRDLEKEFEDIKSFLSTPKNSNITLKPPAENRGFKEIKSFNNDRVANPFKFNRPLFNDDVDAFNFDDNDQTVGTFPIGKPLETDMPPKFRAEDYNPFSYNNSNASAEEVVSPIFDLDIENNDVLRQFSVLSPKLKALLINEIILQKSSDTID